MRAIQDKRTRPQYCDYYISDGGEGREDLRKILNVLFQEEWQLQGRQL